MDLDLIIETTHKPLSAAGPLESKIYSRVIAFTSDP